MPVRCAATRPPKEPWKRSDSDANNRAASIDIKERRIHHDRLVAAILISALTFLATACSGFTTD
ncbi:MAG: hypothetical protein JOZ19_03115 [Rubrobacter sp.]|nr:hypothetical protein [Rubrobacter sp.]